MHPAWAQSGRSNYEAGVRYYQQREYRRAADSFASAVRLDPSLGEALYYLGLSYYQLGHEEKAREVYRMVIKAYQGEPIAKTATQAIAAMDQADRAVLASLPRETWVGYQTVGRTLVVDGAVNGKATPMIFDTGAESSFFTIGQLQHLGISPPTGSPTGTSLSVGQSQGVPNWTMRVDLKVGRIERHNFPILVSSIPTPYPLLGQDFCKGYQFDIDQNKRAISFKLKGELPATKVASLQRAPSMTVDSSGQYVHSVPFVREGNSVIVPVTVNGVVTPMIFDTGAEVCLFTGIMAEKCGIHPDARRGLVPLNGIGGRVMARVGVIDSIKLGPIEKHGMAVSICDDVAADKPLLGQDFFREWRYTIDSQAGVIRFSK